MSFLGYELCHGEDHRNSAVRYTWALALRNKAGTRGENGVTKKVKEQL